MHSKLAHCISWLRNLVLLLFFDVILKQNLEQNVYFCSHSKWFIFKNYYFLKISTKCLRQLLSENSHVYILLKCWSSENS